MYDHELRNLRGPLTDRRETLPHKRDSKMGVISNTRSKNLKALSPKRPKLGAILDNFKLRSRISPEWNEIPTIGKRRADYDDGKLGSTNGEKMEFRLVTLHL